jgi:hypothetical protein
MTVEQRMVFGLDEVKSLIFECNCGARVSMRPEGLTMPPERCPCGHPWDWNIGLNFPSTESPYRAFISSLSHLRAVKPEKFGFRVLMEIEKPQN